VNPGLSVAIITKNEEKHLRRALESVRFADEIVVVDSGSTDQTLDIAREFNCRIFERDWPGYAAQKNFALEQCTRQWVFSLDADEQLTPELEAEVLSVVEGGTSAFELYTMPRLSLFIDKWMRHGGWYPDRQLRLLKNGAGRFIDRPVHECIVSDKPAGRLHSDILHYSYESLEDYIDRMNRYSSLGAAQILSKPGRVRVSLWSLALVLPRKFLEVYVWKRGFLDGRHGFIVSCLAAWGVFLRQAKVWKPESNGDG
jgi:glycosyltransferase involved in cell wall biosynthesis